MLNMQIETAGPEEVIEAVREVTAKVRRINEVRAEKRERFGVPTWESEPWDEARCPF